MSTLLNKLRWLARRRRKEVELRDELAFHLEQELEEGKAAGLTENEARLAARRDLGNLAVVEEDTRAAWGWMWIERLGQDVRYAARMARRKPGFSMAAILTLMLGIGANTAVFSLLDALLMRRLPVDRPVELVRLVEQGPDPAAYRDEFTIATHDALQRGSRSLSGVIATERLFTRPKEIEVSGEKRSIFLQLVSDNYFDVLGVHALRGRVFHQPESGTPGEPIAVLSEEYW